MTRTRWTLFTLLCVTLLRLPVTLLVQRLLPDVSVAPEWNYAAAMLQSIVMFALPGMLLIQRKGRTLQLDRWTLAWTAAAAAVAVLARAALTPLNAWWGSLIGQSGTAIPEVRGLWDGLLRLLALAIVPAIAEELFFRGALLQNLRNALGDRKACGLTTLFFALMHGSLAGLPGHLGISLLLTLSALCSGSLSAPVSMHLIYNVTALVWPGSTAWVAWGCGGVLVLMLAWLLWRTKSGTVKRIRWPEALLCGATLGVMAALYLI